MKSLKTLVLAGALGAALTGCFVNGGDKNAEGKPATLMIGLKVKDVDNLAKPGLGKSSAITLKKLVITLTSSIGTDAVIRDTLIASDTLGSAFTSNSGDDQQVLRTYAVKPLRSWTIQVKTLDINDSIVHAATSVQNNITLGELRPVTLNLTSRFVVYAAKFILPDNIGSSDTAVHDKQKLYVRRFMMVVDGDTVRDTTKIYFAAADTHFVVWDYVRADTIHSLALFVFADSLGDWDPNRPIFGDTIQITSTDTTYTPELPYTGPGSPSDPNYDPANPGGARAGLTINIGAVGLVNIVPSVPPHPLPKRKD